MSSGGFLAIVNITKVEQRGGFDEGGAPIEGAQMEMEGSLLEFKYGNVKEILSHGANTSVFVDIEFTEKQERSDDCQDSNQICIGTIRFNERKDERGNTEILVYVDAKLQLRMLYPLLLLEGKFLSLETIHELIVNPTKEQRDDNIVAFIKRIYFTLSYDMPERPRKKFRLFG